MKRAARMMKPVWRPARSELFDFLAAKTDHVAAKLQFYVYGYNDANQMRGEYEQIT
jgi:ABC-type cobalt transport system substrate-binding protein